MLQENGTDPRRAILASVKRPSRYTGGEWGSGPVKSSDQDPVRVCYAFPDVYEVGMSYLGYQILYGLTRSLPFADAERVYAPWPDMEDALRSSGTKLWALESGRPVSDFDVLGFTLQYELSYTNILTILDLAGIPFRSENRGEKDPIVIAGGPGAVAPEPMAPFIDAFCIGDGEVLVPDVLRVLHEMKGRSREEKIRVLSGIEGVYVPVMRPKKPVVRRIVEDLDSAFYNTEMIVPNTGIVHDRIAVQVFKGCTTVRERTVDEIMRGVDAMLAATGYEELSLISLSSSDYSRIEELLAALLARYGSQRLAISLPSLRIDAFSVGLADMIQGGRKTGLTFAPEAGSQRLRDVINKNVTENDLMRTAEAAFARGWRHIKLYFMLGLPTETDEDVDAIADLVRKVQKVGRAARGGGSADVNVSVATFVPKPHTPFQWLPLADLDLIAARQERLRRALRGRGLNLSWHDPASTLLEAVLSRGDRRLSRVIERAWRSGARFDAWNEHFRYALWAEAFAAEGLNPRFYAGRLRGADEVFPWAHIHTGVDRDYLWDEYQRALRGETTPDCRDGCTGCGVRVHLLAECPPA